MYGLLTFLPHSNFAVLMAAISFVIACVVLRIAQIAEINQIIQFVTSIWAHWGAFYGLTCILMGKKCNWWRQQRFGCKISDYSSNFACLPSNSVQDSATDETKPLVKSVCGSAPALTEIIVLGPNLGIKIFGTRYGFSVKKAIVRLANQNKGSFETLLSNLLRALEARSKDIPLCFADLTFPGLRVKISLGTVLQHAMLPINVWTKSSCGHWAYFDKTTQSHQRPLNWVERKYKSRRRVGQVSCLCWLRSLT